MIVRKPSDIEIEYITNTLINNNSQLQQVIVNSAGEQNGDTLYEIEVHYNNEVLSFVANKTEIIQKKILISDPSNELILNAIKKAAHDSYILRKYKNNYQNMVIRINGIVYIFNDNTFYVGIDNNKSDENLLNSKLFKILNSVVYIEIDSYNYSKIGYIHGKAIRLCADMEEFAINGKNSDNISIKYFQELDENDFFSLSTISNITKEKFLFLCKVFGIINNIKDTKYKIKFGMINNDKSFYIKTLNEYIDFDLEKYILEGIEKTYENYIKIS